MALAGGVAVHVPQQAGYLLPGRRHRCRRTANAAPSTRAARARVMGSGVGVVVAEASGRRGRATATIHAVIRLGGQQRRRLQVGYTAPSVRGQAEAMIERWPAQVRRRRASPTSRRTGPARCSVTPIELEAVNLALSPRPAGAPPCAVGTVKPNIGHLDRAAGVAGLIKTAMMLEHRTIPPQRGFVTANPALDPAAHAFAVANRPTGWESSGGAARRALVNAFGLGGSNAVVVVEEAPAVASRASPRALSCWCSPRTPVRPWTRRAGDLPTTSPAVRTSTSRTLPSPCSPVARLSAAAGRWSPRTSPRRPGPCAGRPEPVRSMDAVRQGVEVPVVVSDALASDPEAAALLSAAEPVFRAHFGDGFRAALRALLGSLGADVEVVDGAADGRPALTGLVADGTAIQARSAVLDVIGQLWLSGAEIDWSAMHTACAAARPVADVPPFSVAGAG